MTTAITLTNDFHGTQATVRPVRQSDGCGYVSRKTALRLRRELCGTAGCLCGGEFGQRGGQYVHIEQAANRGYLVAVGTAL